MGSVVRRIKRNITAKDMAVSAGIVPPVVVYNDPDGNEKKRVFLRQVPMIVYRQLMLKIKARHKRDYALKKKRVAKPENEGPVVRRAFNKIFRRTGR